MLKKTSLQLKIIKFNKKKIKKLCVSVENFKNFLWCFKSVNVSCFLVFFCNSFMEIVLKWLIGCLIEIWIQMKPFQDNSNYVHKYWNLGKIPKGLSLNNFSSFDLVINLGLVDKF